ncbi:MAG TPA: hypothetical protein VJN66_08625 [Rhodanobacteraceae bacterium]|nr:hypothetical protein [Rhodanobacteraceae bacterium]
MNELRRLHCIDGWCVPELSPSKQTAFVGNPVAFLLRADDQTQAHIWAAMRRDAAAWTRGPSGAITGMVDAPEGVTVVGLDDPAELHNAIKNAVGD